MIRNLPGGFATKNYLCLVVDLPKRVYFLSALLDQFLKISFYSLIGYSINDLKSFFQGDSLDESERKKLFFFSLIFGVFIILEIIATILAIN